jgi:cytochrome c oxidase subunit IV
VIQIANFIGPPDLSPFEAVVEKCDFAVCKSTIMKAAIDFKWQRIRWWVCADLACYTISLSVASAAMFGSAWTAHTVGDGSVRGHGAGTSKTAFELMIVLEALLLVLEILQAIVHRRRWLKLQNYINTASILLLLIPAATHLVAHELHTGDIAWQRFSTVLLKNLGSLGLGLKWAGLLGYLDSFQGMSPVHTVLPCLQSSMSYSLGVLSQTSARLSSEQRVSCAAAARATI